jgi:hypothetical protein
MMIVMEVILGNNEELFDSETTNFGSTVTAHSGQQHWRHTTSLHGNSYLYNFRHRL